MFTYKCEIKIILASINGGGVDEVSNVIVPLRNYRNDCRIVSGE